MEMKEIKMSDFIKLALRVMIRSITANEEKRIICVVFADGSKQIVRCSAEDSFDIEVGVSIAVARNVYASRNRLKKAIQSKTRIILPKKKGAESND